MKKIITRIEQEILGTLDNAQLERLHQVLEHCIDIKSMHDREKVLRAFRI